MSIERYHYSELDPLSLGQLQRLEADLDMVLVAMEAKPQPATLSEEQLERIRLLEQKTGKVIVAYNSH